MVTYALTHSRSFAMGIAGGSVTDWRDYDTIYTERYMRMPQNNPDGYERSTSRFAADDLNGALLLVTAPWTRTFTCRTRCSSRTSSRRPASRST